MSLVHEPAPTRVLFGTGTLGTVRDEVERLGRSRVFLVAGRSPSGAGERVADVLGPLLAGRSPRAVVHTPAEVTAEALAAFREAGADCVVAVGGGSAIGLSKAIAVRTGADQVVLPSTYSGSECTAVLGETEGGVKTTRTDEAIRPETVVYDTDLVRDLPAAVAVPSAVNALAHAVEALYGAGATPLTDAVAVEAVRVLVTGLRSGDPEQLLRGAWLAGTCLGRVGMGVQHKLAHTLGGTLDLPHAPTHTVLLPHVIALNAAALPRLGEVLGTADPAGAVHDLVVSAGGPTALRDLGVTEAGLDRVADLAVQRPYPNPVPLTRDGIRDLLGRAWAGARPVPQEPADPVAGPLDRLTAQVVDSFRAGDPRLRELLTGLVRALHGYARTHELTQAEWQAAIDFLTATGHATDERRQEFVLLSDTLGLSSVVDVLTHSRTPDTTSSAVLGPFYTEGPPELAQGADVSAGKKGTPLWVDVAVTGTDDRPVPGAVVDVWQSDEDGFYDLQLPEEDGPVLRGRFRTGDDGRLRFRSILPAAYPIPADGPVGSMLDATGRHPFRAPHLHFLITADGYRELITQLFVAGGAHLDSDAVFGVKEDLIVDFVPRTGAMPDGTVPDGGWRQLTFTFRISRDD
ncbi:MULTISPECIES: maleylacetate reductase and hydroxyquinol 1,2-dioxygenase domain-containing protein [unclassified Pseudonocardia]|uniref:maleylacetate reductase and hydroxyquinol 1,2-dioxygenase domain-containing protein n=1 Tax=unclassified Pseudonocardia TaxID=2619320 RepID=UPI0001FFEC1E|nr:maleylacetate reductase and hydroxyquinol 1,2-dioxygenase domain-containing protein [Pseudonocardia sp. Ae707_Ps1]OLM17506.1 Alcohol dehydrogenase [Pseudonocardia sp. Ae707_Ps1]